VLTIKGHAHTGSWTPDFDFTVKQEMTLTVIGNTAELEMGNLSVDTSSWVIDRFKGTFTDRIRAIRDHALTQTNAQSTVRKALNADEKLGALLDSLLRPQKPAPGPQPKAYNLAYTSAEIKTSGIVLHGTLSVTSWPEGHVEYERIPSTGAQLHGHALPTGPSYSALKSWIPGGTIDRFEWKTFGQAQPLRVDENTFIYTELDLSVLGADELSTSVAPTPSATATPATPVIAGFIPLCLTLKGTRLSASGPVTPQAVSATVCGFNSFPLFDVDVEGAAPMIALTQPGAGGHVEVTGHALATSGAGAARPNLIVHFAGDDASSLDGIARAASESGRSDASAAIVAVIPRDQLPKTKYTPGVVYAEDNGEWEKLFGATVSRRPATLLLSPDRKVLWQKEGKVDAKELTDVLRKSLARTGAVRTKLLRSNVRIGQAPPNFLFEYAPGRELTLRKLVGRRVILVFWKRESAPSLDAVGSLGGEGSRDDSPVIIAIGDGETSARPLDASLQNPATLISMPDADRSISRAYGINIWPTIVSIEVNGLISGVRYGGSEGHRE